MKKIAKSSIGYTLSQIHNFCVLSGATLDVKEEEIVLLEVAS